VKTRIAITGATGLIGVALARTLRENGAQVVTIGRGAKADVRWDFRSELRGTPAHAELEQLDGVVHLSGAPIGVRWTASRRREIWSSRVDGTELLCRALADLRAPPRVLVSGSGIGVYGDRGDEVLTEDSTLGAGFLPDLARAWEGATRVAEQAGIRVAQTRMGIVLSRDGGALAKLLLPFRLGVGGRLGSGRQWMSWIHLQDATRAIQFLLEGSFRGPVNLGTPNPVTNADFTRVLGEVLGRPTVFPVPAVALRAMFGEMADETLLGSQRALPQKLIDAGFVFDESDLRGALISALNS
jgi:uncharacterized protein (TIGR01777 family)